MRWFEKYYSRLLIDNHISEDDPTFMTKFDPVTYVAMVKRAGVDAAMVYSCCHNGNCYYPTVVGHMHKNLQRRDIFRETLNLLNKEGIVPIAYYPLIYHNHSAKSHPSWRKESFDGSQHNGRYWYSCPNNSGYREFAKAQIAEVVSYDIKGIFLDMTFWPGVCVCSNCRERYLIESGREIPREVNWTTEEWVHFQRSRERWMAEFALEVTSFIKNMKPHISVTHQFSPVLAGWLLGQSPGISTVSDYTSGDFYGDKYQHILGAKILAAFSKNVPFEFMTSRCVNLRDHTSMKSESEMFCEVALTLSNGGAYLFIDAINPDGTISEDVFNRIGRVAEKAKTFKDKIQTLRPAIVADVGLYFSLASNVNSRDSGLKLKQVDKVANNMAQFSDINPLKEILGTAIVLSRANIPYRVVTSDTENYEGLKNIIVNDAAFMSEDEVERLRVFVHSGGTLIATGSTSFYNIMGKTSGDFHLSDVFGVSYCGKDTQRISYLAFKGDADALPYKIGSSVGRMQYVLCDTPAPLVKATTATVLAGVCATHFHPDDMEHYASIHSNPHGPLTDYHGLTINSFGKGRCVYLYSSLLVLQNHAQQSFGELLFKEYASSSIVISCDAPPCVDITILKSTECNSYLLCFVNYQSELPNVPVSSIYSTIRLPEGAHPKSCRKVSDGQVIDFAYRDGAISITLPTLETIEILEMVV